MRCSAPFSSYLQEPILLAVENDAGEGAAKYGAGIDVDAVAADFRLAVRSMAVHDDSAEVSIAGEERLPNPRQIESVLIVEGDTRPDAGVAEEKVAKAYRISQVFKERPVIARQPSSESFREVVVPK